MITKPHLQLFIILLVVMLGFIGIALPFPILSPLFLEHQYNLVPTYFSNSARPLLLGLALACYPFGQFLGSPILGGLSDQLGRKKILFFTLLGTVIGYLLCAFAILVNSMWLLIFSRFLTGFSEGNIAIAQSCAADLSDHIQKTRSFGAIYAAAAVGYIIGPLLGGYLSDPQTISWFNFTIPFFAAAVLTSVTAGLVAVLLQETLVTKQQHTYLKYNLKRFNLYSLMQLTTTGLRYISEVWNDHKLKKLLLIHMVLFAGVDLFYEYFPLYLIKSWQSSPAEIGLFTAVFAISYSLSQAVLVPLVNRVCSTINILLLFAILSGLLIIFSLIPSDKNMLYILFSIMGVFFSMCTTNIAVLISNAADTSIQGKVMGVSQSVRVFNDGVVAILGGLAAALWIQLPFIIAGSLMICAGLILIFFMAKKHE